MKTLKLSECGLSSAVLECAGVLRQRGAVAALPTETVYGLVCRWDDPEGVAEIYQLKQRDGRKPLSMFALDVESAHRYGAEINDKAERLFRAFTPGRITIITGLVGGGTLGIRIPDHEFVLALLRELGEPLASTSANLSGMPAALNCADALSGLNGTPAIAVDGGALPSGSLASTVVDVSGSEVRILREGPLSAASIFSVLE